MGHLSANPTGPNPSAEELVRREPESKGHRWLWILALAVLVGVGFWYFLGPKRRDLRRRAEPARDRAGKEQAEWLCRW
jgi:hypothetical protein